MSIKVIRYKNGSELEFTYRIEGDILWQRNHYTTQKIQVLLRHTKTRLPNNETIEGSPHPRSYTVTLTAEDSNTVDIKETCYRLLATHPELASYVPHAPAQVAREDNVVKVYEVNIAPEKEPEPSTAMEPSPKPAPRSLFSRLLRKS